MSRLIGCVGHRIKTDDTEDQHQNRASDCIPKPMSRKAWQSTLKDKDSSVPQYVLDQDAWLVSRERYIINSKSLGSADSNTT
jgi:hypothetical protein